MFLFGTKSKIWRIGAIAPGKTADFVACTADLERIGVYMSGEKVPV